MNNTYLETTYILVGWKILQTAAFKMKSWFQLKWSYNE